MRLTFSDDDLKLCKQIGKQYPSFGELIDRLRAAELEAMALGNDDHFRVFKGRAQILTEIRQAIRS
jgi:hypothetical protein